MWGQDFACHRRKVVGLQPRSSVGVRVRVPIGSPQICRLLRRPEVKHRLLDAFQPQGQGHVGSTLGPPHRPPQGFQTLRQEGRQ